VSPEYNHGYTAVLKNAIDHLYTEWNRKPVGFGGYGNASGARAIEQLRQVAVELEMTPIKRSVAVPLEQIKRFIF
jgi:NAD(P)H-dependent FMN reductase